MTPIKYNSRRPNKPPKNAMTDSRIAAVKILQDIIENKTFASEAKLRFEKEIGGDSAFVNMLVQMALRHLVGIKRLLKQFVKKKLPPRAAFAWYALILGTAEILYLDTPDYAAINSYVELIKKQLDKYVAGFANAVLRRVAAAEETPPAEEEFFPPEFRKILNAGYDKKTVRRIEQTFLNEPALDLTCKDNPELWAQKLGARLLPTGTLRLDNQGSITKLPGFADGVWWVQDFAASLAAKTLGSDLGGKKILDLCAAPGGKTAQLLAQGAVVTALDVSAARLNKLKENMARLRLPAPKIVCTDAVSYLNSLSEPPFDAVLLDAPCSATGTLRRHPELVHIKNTADVEKQAEIQKQILSVVSKALKNGGTLVYCVCSLAKAEGERQIAAFLEQNSEFRLEPLSSFVPAEISEILTPEGCIRTLPCHLQKFGGTDGFFIARLKKGK